MKAAPLRLALLVGAARAFTARPRPPPSRAAGRPGTARGGVNKRRGRLADDAALAPDAARTPRRGEGRRGGSDKGDEAAISPLLAEWAEADAAGGAPPAAQRTAASASPFSGQRRKKDSKNKKGGQRTDRRAARAVLSDAQAARVDGLLGEIEGLLNVTNCDVPLLVSKVAALADLPSESNDRVLLPTLKGLLARRPDGPDAPRPAYRLAWVGSDAALCHVGTSLHKVPLARLQEMYLLLGYNKWELLEVIRILGPFPNVRNTLKGEVKVKRRDGAAAREGAMLRVEYQSMIDGTGKELLAGRDVKTVDLDVWHASERALVCTLPGGGDGAGAGADPLGGDGAGVLLFVAEEDVDAQLEKLRAA